SCATRPLESYEYVCWLPRGSVKLDRRPPALVNEVVAPLGSLIDFKNPCPSMASVVAPRCGGLIVPLLRSIQVRSPPFVVSGPATQASEACGPAGQTAGGGPRQSGDEPDPEQAPLKSRTARRWF